MKAPSETLLTLWRGALAGFSATGPMTVAMVWLHRQLPEKDQYPLPPREITSRLTGDVADPAGETFSALTLANHFAYGAAMGVIYAAVEPRVRMRPEAKGLIQGLMVWLISYLAALPAMGVLKSATRHPAPRNMLMILAHVVWGVLTALIVEALRGENQKGRRANSEEIERDG
jgi:uncharacterized membrane protein YagU involved in acid resistance